MKQCTLKSAFTIKGKGLHTGREIEATFKPAPDNFGRKFLRIDVEGAAPIEAVARGDMPRYGYCFWRLENLHY